MTIEQELIEVLNQLPAAIEKAVLDVLVLRHPGHANQKTHGNRFGGYGTTKESLRRLKDDKGAREKYKATARKKAGGGVAGADKERVQNAKRMAAQKASAPQVLVMGNDVKTLTKQLGLPEDFYTYEVTGDATAFGVRTEIGRHTPNPKYLNKEYSEAKSRLDKAMKIQDRFQQDYYTRKVKTAWADVVSGARKKVTG